jgi:hypothetical protein
MLCRESNISVGRLNYKYPRAMMRRTPTEVQSLASSIGNVARPYKSRTALEGGEIRDVLWGLS